MDLKSKISVLYLTENLDNYKSAEYQTDFLVNLKKYLDIIEYGPGYNTFNNDKTLEDLEQEFNKKFDIIFLGHAFLSDNLNFNIPLIKFFKNTNATPKVMFLNKEYVNLKKKLKFIEDQKINLVFSHHHLSLYLSKFYNKKFIFLPFATTFDNLQQTFNKKYDLSFIGILKNLNIDYKHTNIRENIRDTFFYSFKNINLFKKKEFKKYKFYWINHPRNKFEGLLSKIFFKKWLTKAQYQNIISQSKVTFNTPSPYNIIGPRYYDSLASGTPVICPKQNFYKFYFNKNDLIQFESKNDFVEKFKYLIDNKNYLNEISNKNKLKYQSENYDKRAKIIYNNLLKIL